MILFFCSCGEIGKKNLDKTSNDLEKELDFGREKAFQVEESA